MTEIYYVKPVENSRVAPEARLRYPRKLISLSVVCAILFLAVMAAAWRRFESVQDGYRLEQLQSEKQSLVEANRKLRLEIASLGDPGRIDTIARQQLGMAPASPHQIFVADPVPGATS